MSSVNGAAGNVGAAVAGTYGSLTIAANGSYTYTPQQRRGLCRRSPAARR